MQLVRLSTPIFVYQDACVPWLAVMVKLTPPSQMRYCTSAENAPARWQISRTGKRQQTAPARAPCSCFLSFFPALFSWGAGCGFSLHDQQQQQRRRTTVLQRVRSRWNHATHTNNTPPSPCVNLIITPPSSYDRPHQPPNRG